MTIHLGCTLPRTSCDQPGQRSGEHEPARHERRACCPYLVLLPVGFAVPLPLPDARCALTAPFHPYLHPQAGARRFAFCGTFPGVASAGRYPAPCLRGARTFLAMPPAPEGANSIARSSSRLVSSLSCSINTTDLHGFLSVCPLPALHACHAGWAASIAFSVATVETSARPSHRAGRKCS